MILLILRPSSSLVGYVRIFSLDPFKKKSDRDTRCAEFCPDNGSQNEDRAQSIRSRSDPNCCDGASRTRFGGRLSDLTLASIH